MTTTLLLCRHGRTEANRAGLLLGRSDPDLDPAGRAQAAALGRAVAARGPVTRIVSSPLARTRQTAAAIAECTGGEVTVQVDERWIEVSYGDWEQRPVASVSPETWAAWQADPAFAPPGGESLEALGQRVRRALDDLVGTGPDLEPEPARGGGDGGIVVVVSHVSPIKAAVGWALGVGDEIAWRTFLSPASLSEVSVGPRGRSLRGFNDVAHLADLADP